MFPEFLIFYCEKFRFIEILQIPQVARIESATANTQSHLLYVCVCVCVCVHTVRLYTYYFY